MIFLAILGGVTLLYAILGAAIWFRTHNWAFPVGLALTYYWTYYGAWFIVTDQLRGFSQLRYEYLYAKLFPVELNDAYLWTIIGYGIFLLSLETALLLFVRKSAPGSGPESVPYVSHATLLALGVVFGLASFFVIRDSLGNAAEMNVSSYELVRSDDQAAGMYKIHQLLMRAALLSVTLGLAIWASGKQARVVRGDRSPAALVAYIAVTGSLLLVNVMLGQRRAFAAEAITAGLFYMVNASRPNRKFIFGGAALMILAMGFVGFTRGTGVAAGASTIDTVKESLMDNLVSNEPFAAHLSLYGSIAYRLPPTYGSSLAFLATSFLPEASRPKQIYDYYVERVHAIEGQGYTVHHAAGWYLNFGFAGIAAGGALLGLIWAALYAAYQSRRLIPSHVVRIFATFAIFAFTAFLPSICRDGPEAYKGMLMEVAMIPTAIMWLATIRPFRIAGRPVIAPVWSCPMRAEGSALPR